MKLSSLADSNKVGVYPIVASGASDRNYLITFVNGQLEVKEVDNLYMPVILKN